MALTLCRSRFTPHDLHFVVEKLSNREEKNGALERLCSDSESLNAILDLEPLHHALVEEPRCLEVSPAFYFYVLTRRELLRRGLDDRNLCDYIAAVLTEFSERKTLEKAPVTASVRSFTYVSDLLHQVETAPANQVYGLRRFVGDYLLFLSGVFKENADAKRHGAPGIGFYESIGRQSYRSAAAQPQASQEGLREILEDLGELFHEVRLSLNSLVDRSFHLES